MWITCWGMIKEENIGPHGHTLFVKHNDDKFSIMSMYVSDLI